MQQPKTSDLNNLGVAFLEIGELGRARKLFRNALSCSMEQRTNPEHEQSAFETLQAEYLALKNEMNVDDEMLEQHSIKNNNNEFVHSYGISLPSDANNNNNINTTDNLVNTSVVAAIIIFNLGVVYHLKGLEKESQGRTMELETCKSLYIKSSTILADAGITLTSTGNPTLDLLSMALLNNFAQISYEYLNYTESRRYCCNLVRFCLTINVTSYDTMEAAAIIDKHKSGFLLNAMILQPPTLAAAA